MRQVKSKKNKSTELRLIEVFKENGITGWRRNYAVKGHPDFVFPKQKIAVFVDGCFWHGHDCRNTRPADHQDYWQKKRERKHIWRDYKIKEVYKADSGLSTYTNRVQRIVLDITQNTPLVLSKSMMGVNGNLNAKQIKAICDKHRIRYRVSDDKLVLEKVKKKRNSLAHGDESFSVCARDLTISDLESIKDTVILFISEIVVGMEKYCDDKQYLRAQ